MPADETLRGRTDGPGTSTDGTHDYPSTVTLPDGERHRVLASDRRRHVLDIVATRSRPVALDSLAAAVLAREGADPADGEAREHAAISLHHVHLPLLDDYDVLEYDAEENRVVA